ncbi:serine/threonine-protein kinase STY46 [Pelomyxa schiedti]|nr:serine/threonine-protein kinase STY46 [Pelomyxa schiedti]
MLLLASCWCAFLIMGDHAVSHRRTATSLSPAFLSLYLLAALVLSVSFSSAATCSIGGALSVNATVGDQSTSAAVACGVPIGDFADGVSSGIAVGDEDDGSVLFSWYVSPHESSVSAYGVVDCDLARSLAPPYSATWVTSSPESLVGLTIMGLNASGIAPVDGCDDPGNFTVSFDCSADVLFQFKITFAFTELDATATTASVSTSSSLSDVVFPDVSITTFVFNWQCTEPGCTTYCAEHGTCHYAMGVCECNEGWLGDSCGVMFVRDPPGSTYCPDDSIQVTWDIPASIYGQDGAVNGMWYGTTYTTSYVYTEVVYFIGWGSIKADDSTPGYGEESTGTNYMMGYYSPGTVRLKIGSDTTSTLYWTELLEILSWEDCGYNSTCGDDTSNTCGEESGWGQCNNGVCECNSGHYWYDCSRGCDAMTVLTGNNGVFESDSNYKPQRMHYITAVECWWDIHPTEDYDDIEFGIPLFDLAFDDYVNFYAVDEYGNYSEPEVTMYGDSDIQTVKMTSKRVFVQFVSNIQNTRVGFSLNYTTTVVPLPGWAYFLMAMGGAIVIAIVAIISAVRVSYVMKQRQIRREQALNMPPEILPYDKEAEIKLKYIAPDPNLLASQLEEFGVQLAKLSFNFNLASSDAFPVNQVMNEDIWIANLATHNLKFCFYIPETLAGKFAIRPGQGVISPGKVTEIKIEFTLLYTTHFSHCINLELSFKDESMTVPFILDLEGAVSDRLDPEEFENYQVMAEGTYSTVFKVTYRSQPLAVKVLKQQDEEAKKSFEKECMLLQQIRHRYIVSFVGASWVPGKYSICTELLEKGSIKKFLHDEKNVVSYPLILKFASNVAEAMAYLHSNKILYRDLKCANILLVSTAINAPVNCKLTDFGTSRAVDDADTPANHTHGLGTPIFMAPEMLAADMYSSKADVFSYGVVLWEMLCRQTPWADVSVFEFPDMVKSGRRLPIPSNCPPGLSKLMTQCWEHDPAQRPDFVTIASDISALCTTEIKTEEDEYSPAAYKDKGGHLTARGLSMRAKTMTARSTPRTRPGTMTSSGTNRTNSSQGSQLDSAARKAEMEKQVEDDASKFKHIDLQRQGKTLALYKPSSGTATSVGSVSGASNGSTTLSDKSKTENSLSSNN